jgi:uncharacterized protein DUF1761
MTMNTKSLSINYLAVIVTGIIAFILSLIWYSPFVFGKIWMEHRHAPIQSSPSWTMIFAPLRELIASYVMALLITRLTITDWKKSVRLTFLLWLAFHAVGMAGAIIWDNMPWKLGLVHAGDWLMKMLFMAVVLSLWHNQKLSTR